MTQIANNQSGQQQNSNTDAHQKACVKIPTIEQVIKLIPTIRHFLSRQQLTVMADGCRGEERDYFKSKIGEIFDTVETMPMTYGTDGQGDDAVVYLHYYLRDCDWYVTERDMTLNEQRQAFGMSAIWEEELGYISISEIVANGAELDLHWAPKTLRQVKSDRATEHALTDFNSPMSHHHY